MKVSIKQEHRIYASHVRHKKGWLQAYRLLGATLAYLLHISMAVASTYNLRVEVTPNGSGTLNTSGGTYEEGSSVLLRTYGNTSFVFKGWYEGDSLLSSATSFNYFIPANDVLVQARYEYDPTVPGNPAMPDTTTYYDFTAIVSPIGAGTLNTYSGKYAANTKINLKTYVNTGYQFVGWQNDEGEVISSATSFSYTMPCHDSQLTALYVYNPSVPANPDSMGTCYTVNVACKPVGGGTFNTTSATAEEGGNVHLYAYTNTGYKFLHWENEDGETISTAQNFYYVIPHGDSKIYGIFEYDPAVPEGPNKNYWDETTGEVIVDDFTPGSLYSAITTVIGGSGSSYRNKVKKITVAGKMSSNDFGIANNFANCFIVDISRTYGYTEIPSYAFDYNTGLQHILLPACVTAIGYQAFYQCSNLVEISCYAEIPPTVGTNAFYGVADRVVVHVPYSSIQLYSEAEGWKALIIESFNVIPTIEDFTFTDDLDITYSGQPYEFPISSVPGMGNISVRYTDTLGVESTEGPTAIGKYCVSIDVDRGEYFTAASFDSIASFTIYVMDDVEWYSLRVLYEATKGDSAWTNKWKVEDGVAAAAAFYGLTFKKGHIVGLNLSNNNLQDTLPATGFTLPYLEELNMSGNKLMGNIGTIAASCPQLRKLDVQGNCFTDVYPMLPKSMEVSLKRQTIEPPLLWDGAQLYSSKEGATDVQPTILTYNHEEQCYANPEWFVYNQQEAWEMWLTIDAANNTSELTDMYGVYNGKSGDTLEIQTRYPQTSIYSKAKMIFRFAQGDANISNTVDVLDLQSIINYIFKEYHYLPFNYTAANVQSEDNKVDVLDVIALIDILLSDTITDGVASYAKARMVSEGEAEAYVYWENNRLMLETTKDIAAIDLMLEGEAPLEWNKALGMTIASSKRDDYQRFIGYSLSGKHIPQGKHVLLTATKACDVVSTLMADQAAQGISVALKSPETTAIENICMDDIQCRLHGGQLQLIVGGDYEQLVWEVYAADGSLLDEGQMPDGARGTIKILPVKEKNTMIVVVKNRGDIILTQKINSSK